MKKLETAIVVMAVLLIPGTAAFAQSPAAESAAAPAAEPAPAATPAPAEPAPAATPAQEDVSGGNEYTEQAPPTGTGEPEDTTPPADDTDETPPQQAAPTGGGTTPAPTAVAADTTDSEATDGLPRTGSEGLIISLIGIALVGSGILLRRAVVPLR